MKVKYEVCPFDGYLFGLDMPSDSNEDILKQIELSIEQDLLEAQADPLEVLQGKGKPVHIGFDTEYEYNEATKENDILLYGFYLVSEWKVLKGVIYPSGRGKKHRLTFKKLFGNILHLAKKEGVISDWPSVTYIYSHFLRADVSSWADFWQFSNQVKGVAVTISGKLGSPESSLTSVKNGWGMGNESKKTYRPEPIFLADCNRRGFRTYVNFIDTLLITPGQKGLALLGNLLNFPKMELPEGYDIAKISKLIAELPDIAEQYNITDAQISVIYGLVIQQFVFKNLGLKKMPTTIGGIAVALFRKLMGDTNYFNEVFGIDYVQSQVWHSGQQRVQKKQRKVESVSRRFHSQFFIDSYAGGLNTSCYFGPSEEGLYNDFDLASAYVIAMLDIYPLDYAGSYESKNPQDFVGHVMGSAYLRFKFPQDTLHPNLVVKTDDYGLISPLEGACYATAPEIEMALKLNADIEIIHGVIIPWRKDKPRIFEQFVRWVREERAKYDEQGETLLAEFVKAIGNTLYGKTATLKAPSFFDTESNDSKSSTPSSIANPYIASHVTGLVRATLSELINDASDAGHNVISATTDGFLTDAPDLALTGVFAKRYQALCDLIDGNEAKEKSMLKLKHWVCQLISTKTRGQCTAKIAPDRLHEVDKKIVLAKAGIKAPKAHNGVKLNNDEAINNWYVDLFLNRQPGDRIDSSHFNSIRDQWKHQADLIKIQKDVLLNMEYDMKRKPVNPRMMAVHDTEHLAFDTVPWQSDAQMQQTRALFDGWRKPVFPKLPAGQAEHTTEQIKAANEQANCLKTLEDFYHFEEYKLCHLAVDGKRGINVQKDLSVGILKRWFLRALVRSKFGLDMQSYNRAEIANWLTDAGYSTSVDDIANAARRGATLPPDCVPVVATSLELLSVITAKFPAFEYQAVFNTEYVGTNVSLTPYF